MPSLSPSPSPYLFYTTRSYAYLANAFTASTAFETGTIETKFFPDGERYVRILDRVAGRDVVVLGGTPADLDWIELYDLGCAISHAGAHSLSLLMPYFGYATMERAVKPGEVVTAKTRARLISSIPPCRHGNRVFLFDLHTDGIEFYFGDDHSTHHLYGAPLITETIRKQMSDRPYILGATDAGRAKWVQSLAQTLGVEPAFVYKKRDTTTGKTTVTGINANVHNREVMIYDDMIRTGSSLLQAGRAYLEAGACKVHAIASHLVLPEHSLESLWDSGVFTSISGTNSHPSSKKLLAHQGTIACIAPMMIHALHQTA